MFGAFHSAVGVFCECWVMIEWVNEWIRVYGDVYFLPYTTTIILLMFLFGFTLQFICTVCVFITFIDFHMLGQKE